MITKCRILQLDEATSALDAESEHLVQQEAIDKAVFGRTVSNSGASIIDDSASVTDCCHEQ